MVIDPQFPKPQNQICSDVASLKIFHQNIRGLRGKHHELMGHLTLNMPQVLCFTEHHMKDAELQTTTIDHYSVGAYFCRTKHAQGGVVIYTHSSLNPTSINLTKYCKEKDIEICAVKITVQSMVLCIITVYRSPTGNFNLFLESVEAVLQFIYSPTQRIIICGDINIDYLLISEQRKQLDNLLLLYNLASIVNFPTRITNTSSSSIDNVFIDVSGFDNYTVFPFPNGLSDHDAQILVLRSLYPGQFSGAKFERTVNQQTTTDFIFALSSESWSNIFNIDDVNQMYNSFLNTYLRIFNASFPLTRVVNHIKGNQWITAGILISCKRKRELFLLCRTSNNPVLKQYYKKYCNMLVKVIRVAKRMTYSARISASHNKTKTTWNILNELLGRKQSPNVIQKLTIGGIHLTNQQCIAEGLNKHFTSIIDAKNLTKVPTLCDNTSQLHTYSPPDENTSYSQMVFKPFTTNEIISIIKLLKTKNSFGYDEISPRILKISANYISSPLTHICNRVISTGVFPDRMKYSTVTPIYKKGVHTDPTNYRPISVITSFAKVLETALYRRIVEHISSNNIMTDHQFGFRKGCSTDEAIFKLVYEVLKALNDKAKVGSVFLDLEKAFDSVNHSLLIKKLPFYGINGKAKQLIESYLLNRYQRVILKNFRTNSYVVSEWERIKHGVPQGSVLGPLLFLLYINDLPQAAPPKTIPIIFADDTSLLIASPNTCELLKEFTSSLSQLNKWLQQNSLILNISKTYFLLYHNKNQIRTDLPILLDNKPITRSTQIKFLGLTIDDSMSWNSHIDTILPRLSSACFAMRATKPYFSDKTMTVIYYANFHAIMSYGVIFWGQSKMSYKVFLLQKRAIRIMTGCGPRDSCRKLFTELGILTLPSQYIFSLLLFMVKNRELFPLNHDMHSIGTRQQQNFHLPSVHLEKYQSGPHYMGLKLYNALPAFLKTESHNPVRFKLSLKKFLLESTIYSIEEFYTICKSR